MLKESRLERLSIKYNDVFLIKEEVKIISDDLYQVSLRVPSTSVFEAGDCLSINIKNKNGKVVGERIYSINRTDTNHVYLLIKQQKHGLGSNFLINCEREEKLTYQYLPAKRFYMKKSGDEYPILMIAAGSGISPFVKYIQYLGEKQWNKPVYLLLTMRNFEGIMFLKNLLEGIKLPRAIILKSPLLIYLHISGKKSNSKYQVNHTRTHCREHVVTCLISIAI